MNPITKQGEIQELALLFDINQALSLSLDLKKVLGPVLKILAERLGLQRGTLTILNRHTGEIFIDEAYGLSLEQRAKGRYKLGEGITGKVIESGKPAVIPRISEEPLFLDRTESRKKLVKKDISFICVPIQIGTEAIGALSVDLPYNPAASLDRTARLLSVVGSLIAQAVRLRQSAEEEVHRLQEENLRLKGELKDRFRPSNIIGNSRAMRNVFELIEKVAGSNATTLILGESGVGKELVAQAIHYRSPRANEVFISFNAAALPEEIAASELFGHEKGSFTGAEIRRKGRFELASGGTLFIDEVGDMPLSLQAKLLRVLQERSFERVGGTEKIEVDVRIIAATNHDLEKLVKEKKFRLDLYYRLNVFPIVVPPLRDRRTDIPLLTDHFIENMARAAEKELTRISTPAIDLLMNYHWPGNVRELANVIERAVLLSTDGVIHGYHLPPTLQMAEENPLSAKGRWQARLDSVEKEMLVEALKVSRGTMAPAARALGITERMMGLYVKRHGIDPRRFRVPLVKE